MSAPARVQKLHTCAQNYFQKGGKEKHLTRMVVNSVTWAFFELGLPQSN